MSDQPRRRLRPAPARRRVGQPNVLSNQATPNRLSTMGAPGRSASTERAASTAERPAAARPASGREAVVRPRAPMGIPTQGPAEPAQARRRRLPSFGTLLFIAFVIYWAVRVLGNAGIGLPFATTAPAPGGVVGDVTFGLGLDDDCSLTQPAGSFPTEAQVWWRAELAEAQSPDAAALVRTYRDGGQIDRQEVPAEPEFGEWDVLCAGEPVAENKPGTYRVEVWTADERVLLAAGSYTKADGSP